MDHGRNHSLGQESHGVHMCRKCGWSYPKPHPSARHRRAHRKICGTIEGFKLVSNRFDDEPNSDGDNKTPSTKVPNVMEISSLDGGIGTISNRSEHEVFSDAAMEFQDKGFGVERQDSFDNVSEPDKIADKDLIAKHFEDSDNVHQMPNVSTGSLEHRNSEDRNASASDLVPIETETLKGVSEESKKEVVGASDAECSVECPTDANGNEEGKLNENAGLIGEIVDRDCVSQDKCDTALTNQVDEDIEIDASYMHVEEDTFGLGGNHEAVVKEVLFEEKADVLQSHIDPVPNLHEVDDSNDIGEKKTEQQDIDVVESGDGLDDLIKANSTSESISIDNQSLDFIEEVNETEDTHLDRVSNRGDDVKEPELSRDNKVQGEGAGEDSALGQLKKELIHLASYSEPTGPSSGAVDDNHGRDSGPASSQTSTAILQGESNNDSVKPQLDSTVVDVSIGSSSHSDSLEAHWGSISVLSTQSDPISDAEKAKNSKVASEQRFNKSGEFDLPSFTTLVEPTGGDQEAVVSEIQAVPSAQSPRAMPLQAGLFPSLTHVTNESPGRKNNEEVIKMVTNWNGKQHTPLMNLLTEANSETKPMSVRSKQSPSQDNEDIGAKVSLNPGLETDVAESTLMEQRNEWNSPARFPAEIKQKKRKVKGRPLWVQFVCCSSIK